METPPKPLRIAIVDDHPGYRAGVASLLADRQRGHVVLQATDGVDYEKRCAEVGHVHIAIVDLSMPRRDGYQTMRWMARHQPRTKAAAITFDPAPASVQRALEAGACAVLPKTIEPADLMRALEHVHIAGFHYNDLVSKELRRSVDDKAALRPTPDELWDKLAPREKEFFLLYTDPKGYTLKVVAERMGVGEETVETYRKNVAKKLDAKSKSAMVRMVVKNGWG